MILTYISLKNVCGFQELEEKLPAVCLIQGDNGTGKSSLLRCIKYGFERGHDPEVLSVGAEMGEILVTLDNGSCVRTRIKLDKTERSYRAPGSKKWSISRAEIDELVNAISYDPLSFMELPERSKDGKKGQIETLLTINPVEVKHEEIVEALGDCAGSVAPCTDGLNSFDTIAAYRRTAYDLRTKVNGQADVLTKHAGELRKALPADGDPTDWKAAAEDAARRLREIQNLQKDLLDGYEVDFETERKAAYKVYDDAVAAALRARDKSVAEARATVDKAKDAARKQDEGAIARLTAEQATAQERSLATARASGTKESVEKAEKDAQNAKSVSTALTAVIERFDALNATLAGRLKIPGVNIVEGRIVDEAGVPFSSWNTTAKMTLCFKIAVRAYGKLGFIVVDDLNHYTEANRKAMIDTAIKYSEKSDIQFFLATAVKQPLQIASAKGDGA